MPADLPSALTDKAAVPNSGSRADRLSWLEVGVSIFLTTVAVLLVSFLSVVTNL